MSNSIPLEAPSKTKGEHQVPDKEKPGLRITAYAAAAGSIAFALLAVASAASVVAAPATPIFAALAMGCMLGGIVAWQSKNPDQSDAHPGSPPALTPQGMLGNHGVDASQLNIESNREHSNDCR